MTKSSEVLRLAAKLALSNEPGIAEHPLSYVNVTREIVLLAEDVGYCSAEEGEETCMVLCLAAAIAESEGD